MKEIEAALSLLIQTCKKHNVPAMGLIGMDSGEMCQFRTLPEITVSNDLDDEETEALAHKMAVSTMVRIAHDRVFGLLKGNMSKDEERALSMFKDIQIGEGRKVDEGPVH